MLEMSKINLFLKSKSYLNMPIIYQSIDDMSYTLFPTVPEKSINRKVYAFPYLV